MGVATCSVAMLVQPETEYSATFKPRPKPFCRINTLFSGRLGLGIADIPAIINLHTYNLFSPALRKVG